MKKVKGKWYEVGDRRAKEKTGQTMRDLLHTRYSSSTKAKARARRQLRDDYHVQSEMNPIHQLPQREDSRSRDFFPRRRPEQSMFHSRHQQQEAGQDPGQSIGERWAKDMGGYVQSISGDFRFPMADEAFSKPDARPSPVKDTLDLDLLLEPLPIEDSIVDLDFDAKLGDGGGGDISEDSFRAAMDTLFSTLSGGNNGLTEDTVPVGILNGQQNKNEEQY